MIDDPLDDWDPEPGDDWDDWDPETLEPDFQRFIDRHIVEIIENGDWEYGNAMPMTQDAEAFLEHYRALVANFHALSLEVDELRKLKN